MSDAEAPIPESVSTAQDLANDPGLVHHFLIGLTASLTVVIENMVKLSAEAAALAQSTMNVHTEVKLVDERRKRDRIIFGFMGLVFLIVLIVGAFVVINQGQVIESNREQLTILRNATGPDAVTRQQQAQDFALARIKCDGEDNLRAAAAEWVKAIPDLPVPPVSDFCVNIRRQQTEAATTPAERPGG